MWFDSHCHLHLCAEKEPVEAIIDRARLAGVVEMLTVGIDAPSSREAVEIATTTGVYASVGVHPNSATEWNAEVAAEIEELARNERVVAIGETGLDLYWDRVPLEVQKEVFAAHIDLAKRSHKTLVIHTRDSIDEALEVLGVEGAPEKLIFHCWSGTTDQMGSALDMGAFVSFAGNTSFKNAQNLRDIARIVPDSQLLVETDSPYLTPMPHRGTPNEPRHLPFVGVAVAASRDRAVPEISDLTTSNARRAFSLTS